MTDKEKILEDAGETIEYAKQYIQQQKAAFKLDVAERMSRVLSNLMVVVILFILALFIIVLFSCSIALFIGQLCGSNGIGFLCITAFYLLICCFIVVFRKTIIINPIITIVLKAFFK